MSGKKVTFELPKVDRELEEEFLQYYQSLGEDEAESGKLKRGRPPGQGRIPWSTTQRQEQNAQLERIRREKEAERWKVLNSTLELPPNASRPNIIREATSQIENLILAHKKLMENKKYVMEKHKKLKKRLRKLKRPNGATKRKRKVQTCPSEDASCCNVNDSPPADEAMPGPSGITRTLPSEQLASVVTSAVADEAMPGPSGITRSSCVNPLPEHIAGLHFTEFEEILECDLRLLTNPEAILRPNIFDLNLDCLTT